jgi:5-methylcytosine-specific restriction endonuclease McrA
VIGWSPVPAPPPDRDRPPSLWDDGGNVRLRRDLCAYVLERDAYTCHWCGRPAGTVDHVIARALGGTDALTNLVAACSPCNSARGAALTNQTPEPSRRW